MVDGGADLYSLVPASCLGTLLVLVQAQGVQLGMTFLDGTSIRAHQKAAGAAKKAALQHNETIVKRLAGLVAAMAPRLA